MTTMEPQRCAFAVAYPDRQCRETGVWRCGDPTTALEHARWWCEAHLTKCRGHEHERVEQEERG